MPDLRPSLQASPGPSVGGRAGGSGAGRVVGVLCTAVALLGPVRAGHADDIRGLWLVEDGDARVRIAACGEALCGRIVWLEEPLDEQGKARRDTHNRDPALRDRQVLGMRILERVSRVADRHGVWSRGRIYDPQSGKTYRCTLKLERDGRLKLRGYIGFSLFGRTSRWTRVTDAPPERTAVPPPRPVWIDTDVSAAPGGHELDDGLALVQAFHSPGLVVRGVTAVFGNAPLEQTFAIARDVVDRFGPPGLEVFAGAAGADRLGEETPASRGLAEALRAERLSVLALGPVTTVATVVRNHPELVQRIVEIVAVAGRRPGQRFTVGSRPDARPLRDLNFELDAAAFQVLLDAEVPIVLAPFEISSKVRVTETDAARLAAGPEPIRWFARPIADWLALWRAQFGVEGFHPFDTLAVAYATTPEWIRWEDLPVEIRSLPDDTHPGAGGPMKPYLLVSAAFRSSRRVRYCFDVTGDFKEDLMAKLLRQ